MLGHYRILLNTRHALPTVLGAAIARYPSAMMPLGLLLSSSAQFDSLAIGGFAAGAHGLATAVFAPMWGRWADRSGARRMLLITGMAYPSAVAVVLFCFLTHAPLTVLFPAVVCAGATVPAAASVVRASWREISDPTVRQAIFSADSAAVGVVFISGPALVALAAALFSPSAAMIFAGAAACVGALVIATCGLRAPTTVSKGKMSSTLIFMFVTVWGMGLGFGALDVAVTGFVGGGAIAGFLLAIWASASAIGGLWYGIFASTAPLNTQYRWALLAMSLGHLPLVLAAKPSTMALLLLFAGLTVAPTFATQAMLAAELAPNGSATETFTWVGTMGYLGMACGAGLGGVLVEWRGPDAAFLVGAAGPGLGFLVATVVQWLYFRLLTPVSEPHAQSS